MVVKLLTHTWLNHLLTPQIYITHLYIQHIILLIYHTKVFLHQLPHFIIHQEFVYHLQEVIYQDLIFIHPQDFYLHQYLEEDFIDINKFINFSKISNIAFIKIVILKCSL